jgi:hypothetical protein
MEEKGWQASTNEKLRQVVKLFHKIAYCNNESYPEQLIGFLLKFGSKRLARRHPLWICPKIFTKGDSNISIKRIHTRI